MGRRISKEFLHPSILEGVNDKIGNLDSLETDAKGNMVQAINELVEKLDNSAEIENGKELIANAVGEPLTAEESFDEMSSDINSLLSTFKTNMMKNGITVESGDKFKQLIDKIATMVEEGEGKGIQYKTGTKTVTGYSEVLPSFTYDEMGIDFTPTLLFIQCDSVYLISSMSIHVNKPNRALSPSGFHGYFSNITNSGFQFMIGKDNYTTATTYNLVWHAIGVGEEDTTLRDSLADILENKGVDVTEEDDMASLISKVDERIVDIDIKDLFCGYGSSFLLKKDNSLWGCGLAANIGTTSNMNTFTHLMDDVKQVACNGSNGAQHVMVLKNDGSLWCCGDNGVGQLGLGNTTLQKTFTQVTTGVKEVHCGAQFTYIIKNDNSLWSCGYNANGQLGLGTSSSGDFKKSFSQVTVNVSDIKQFGCSFNNAWMLKNDGTLWATGLNSNDMLGLGNTNSRNTFTQIATNVNQIYTGVSNSIFIVKNDGTLWACGWNYYGQLGVGYANSTDATAYQPFTKINIDANDVKTIATGHTFTVLLKKNGSLWGCGYDSNNELGSIYPSTNKYVFTSISNINNNLDVRCSLDHVLVLKNDNKIWAAGDNYSGQLGLGYATTSGNVSGFLCYGGSF